MKAAKRTASSETINIEEGDPVAKIREMTNGRGADVCVDAVGLEAERSLPDKIVGLLHFQSGSIAAFKLAVDAVRRGGTVSVVGVYGSAYDKFPLGQIFDKGISLRFGQAPVQKYIDDLINLVSARKIRLNDIITHRLSLDDAPHGYQIFKDKQEDCVKVVLQP